MGLPRLGEQPRTPRSWAPGLSFTRSVEGMGGNGSPRACPLRLGTGPEWCLFTSSHTHGRDLGRLQCLGSPGGPLDLLWGSLGGVRLRPTPCPTLSGSAFTWEVKANNRTYNDQFKEKAFLCWQRKKYKVDGPSLTALPSLLPPSLPLPPSFNHEQITSLVLEFLVCPWPHPSSP